MLYLVFWFRKAPHRQFHSCLEPSVCPATLPLWSKICFQLQPVGTAACWTFNNRISSVHGELALSWLAGISGYADSAVVPREPSHLWPSLSSLCSSRSYILASGLLLFLLLKNKRVPSIQYAASSLKGVIQPQEPWKTSYPKRRWLPEWDWGTRLSLEK